MRIAVLGLGFMGSTHLKALQNIAAAELIAVSSNDEKKLAGDLSGVQGNLGGPGEKMDFSRIRKFHDWRRALLDPDIEAVDICLPTHLHAEASIAALGAGKHVLVEKPMALDASSAALMIAAATSHQRILMSAQVLRFFPAYRTLRDILNSDRIGAVRSAVFRRRCAAPAWSGWLSDGSKSGGGVFDLLIHDVDMCLHLFGRPEAVSATGCEALASGIDTIVAQLYYPRMQSVTVMGGWHHPKTYPFSMEYTVTAERGTVEYNSAGRPPTLYDAEGTEASLAQPEIDGYAAEIEYFLSCCHNNRQPELCPPAESADAVTLTRLMSDARQRNGEKVQCKF